MQTDTIFQPENLSTAEWELLQLLAIYTGSFSVEAVLARQSNETLTESETLNFYRRFYRLKNCGYIEVLLSAENEDDNQEHIYKLSATGIKAVLPKERSVYPMKSAATRRGRNPNSLYQKKNGLKG